MNFDDVFTAQNTNGISPEKLAFLKAMSARQSGGNAKDMMAALMAASSNAQKQGISFNESERDMMLEILLKNLPPEESKKAQGMIQMMKRMNGKKGKP